MLRDGNRTGIPPRDSKEGGDEQAVLVALGFVLVGFPAHEEVLDDGGRESLFCRCRCRHQGSALEAAREDVVLERWVVWQQGVH
eukprot:13596815-Heterocapsa_arctica.AAC.1